MNDFISRDTAKQQMRNGRHSIKWLLESGAKTIGEAFEIVLDEVPAADVRPVVLCRDCYAYRRDKELAEAAYLDPKMYCGLLRCEMGEDSFCSYGKRKGEKS